MAEDSKIKKNDKADDKEKRMEKLREKSKSNKKVNPADFVKQLATRQKLERDYDEDKLYVTFYSSPETKRTILARKPNQDEFIKILTLTIQSANLEGRMDIESLTKMKDIVTDLNVLAAELTLDSKLDEEFWAKKVSFNTLQNFIAELITESQRGTGLTEEEMKSFR